MANELTHPVTISVKKNLALLGVTTSSGILVGVSGGVDSMVLLYILHKLGHRVSAAHVNFNLRGEESHNDALFVKRWCQEQGISSFELSQDTKEFAAQNELNTQAAARQIRYEWWELLVHSHRFDYVATAHHLDDTIETVFLNLIRGTGIKGLRGIPSHRDYFIRPLLESSRREIEDFALEYNIPYRTDSSNLSDDYLRNRLRHQLIPLWEELADGFHATMKHTLHRVNMEWDAWEHAYQQWQFQKVKPHRDGFLIEGDPREHSYLMRWLEERNIPWNLSLDFVMSERSDPGHFLNYNKYRLSRTENGFYFEEVQPTVHLVFPREGNYPCGDFNLTIELLDGNAFIEDQDPFTEYVNTEVIEWPLHMRPVQAGDHFQPFGMKGKTKKIQDLLVDLKLEPFEKERQLILSNHQHIIWVVGLRLDERARIQPQPNKIYRIRYEAL